jgi:hypothetical protein
MVTYVYRDGQRLTPWMAYTIDRLSADMHSLFGVWVKVRSAIRTYEDQKRIFLERYVTAGNVNGRRVYDTRWWQGRLWYRISAAGTVAVPGTSNHEIQGSKAAVDLYDTGSDAGITSAGNRRSNWLRANAHRYGLVASGYGFREPWHYDVLNIFQTPPSAPAGGGSTSKPAPAAPDPEEDDDMAGYSGFYYTRKGSGGVKDSIVYLIVNGDESTYHEYSNGAGNGPMPSKYNNAIAAAYRTGSFAPITEGHARVIKAQNKAEAGMEYVELNWDDVEQVKVLLAAQGGDTAARAENLPA